jgi:hypothetical protein
VTPRRARERETVSRAQMNDINDNLDR